MILLLSLASAMSRPQPDPGPVEEPVVVTPPVVEVPVVEAPTPVKVTWTGDECEPVIETDCPWLKTRTWLASCEALIPTWQAAGVTTISPCANAKYAADSCEWNAILTHPETIPEECIGWRAALEQSAADFLAECLYTTTVARGRVSAGVCAGIMASPSPMGSTGADAEPPFDRCVREHLDVVTLECSLAYSEHIRISGYAKD